jgi:hypothetical protein
MPPILRPSVATYSATSRRAISHKMKYLDDLFAVDHEREVDTIRHGDGDMTTRAGSSGGSARSRLRRSPTR